MAILSEENAPRSEHPFDAAHSVVIQHPLNRAKTALHGFDVNKVYE
jgi:hypothetical protein